MFAIGSMTKDRKINTIEYGIKQVHKIYLQRGFKTTRIHADGKFEPIETRDVRLWNIPN